MGTFTTLVDHDNKLWQTKALDRLQSSYQLGDTVPSPLSTCQIAIYGPEDTDNPRDSFAVVEGFTLTEIDVGPRPGQRLISYGGNLMVPDGTGGFVKAPTKQVEVTLTEHQYQKLQRVLEDESHFSPESLIRAHTLTMVPQDIRHRISNTFLYNPELLSFEPSTATSSSSDTRTLTLAFDDIEVAALRVALQWVKSEYPEIDTPARFLNELIDSLSETDE